MRDSKASLKFYLVQFYPTEREETAQMTHCFQLRKYNHTRQEQKMPK